MGHPPSSRTDRARAAAARLRGEVEDNILQTSCIACGAAAGERCTTMIDGVDMGWHHDVRVYAANGWRHKDDRSGGVA